MYMIAVVASVWCLQSACAVVAVRASVVAATTRYNDGAAVLLDGDTPWLVPPEISRPSEQRSDALADTAQALALRDVELDWYKVGSHCAIQSDATCVAKLTTCQDFFACVHVLVAA